MADLIQQARELLTAAWIEAGWPPEAAAVLASGNDTQLTVQLSALAAALRAAPDEYVLVPAEPTEEMKRAGTAHVSNPYGLARDVWAAMLAARPQGVSRG